MNIKNFFLFFFPFVISIFLIFISNDKELWMRFWTTFNVPDQIPPFSDLDAISKAVKSKLDGFNPYYENPYDIKKNVYIYPSFWLYLFDLFNLQIEKNFKVFCFIVLYLYCFIFINIFFHIKKFKFKLFYFLAFFSTSNLLVIERLNIELIIFILVYYLAVIKNYYLKMTIFCLSLYAKLYPIFAVFIFLKNKIIFFGAIFLSFLIFFILREEISFLMNSGIEYALLASHGIPSLTKGFWYYSNRFNFFIDNNNYSIFKYICMFIGFLYALILVKINFKFNQKFLNKDLLFEESLFICGSGIYIGKFLTFGNFDYGLIFLILTFPYFSNILNSKVNIFYFLIVIICMNSLIFEGGDRYNIVYFTKAFVIHFLKIIIFSINCFYFGKIINNHLQFNIKI